MSKKLIIERVGQPAKKSYKKGDKMLIGVDFAIGHIPIEYPENKTLKKLKAQANREHLAMLELLTGAHVNSLFKEKYDKAVHKWAKTVEKIEAEATQPNFGDR